MTDIARVGRRVEVSRTVAVDREAAWDLVTDTTRWPEWGPSVRAVDCERRFVRPGTTGRVRTPLGWAPFRVVDCAPYRWTWRVAGVPATGHRVDTAAGGCRVVFEVPLAAAPYAAVCAVALRRIAAILVE
jgi:hypothetical protein